MTRAGPGVPEPGPAADAGQDPRAALRADCAKCWGLCCVLLPFAASADFAIDKAAGQPCPHLTPSDRCGIHDQLRPRGFPGCSAYDCFGAGQHVVQVVVRGPHWRSDPDSARAAGSAFPVVRALHELLWYIAEALDLEPAGPDRAILAGHARRIGDLTHSAAAALAGVDVDRECQRVNESLQRVSERVRAGAGGRALRGADLVGADLRKVDLCGADLRGALLIGADLRGADLALADLRGCDLRAADLRAADLSRGLFLTQSQVGSARGDAATGLPAVLGRPTHWWGAAAAG